MSHNILIEGRKRDRAPRARWERRQGKKEDGNKGWSSHKGMEIIGGTDTVNTQGSTDLDSPEGRCFCKSSFRGPHRRAGHGEQIVGQALPPALEGCAPSHPVFESRRRKSSRSSRAAPKFIFVVVLVLVPREQKE